MYDDLETLLREIAAGEDTYLELKEVVFRKNKVRFARESGRAGSTIAEVFVSLANTAGGVVLFGVRDDGEIVGVDPERRELLEQFVVNTARDRCEPRVELHLDWIRLPDGAGADVLCLKVHIERSPHAIHRTSDGRYLERTGSHRDIIPTERLQRLLATRHLVAPFEEWPAVGASMDEIDEQRFNAYLERRFGRTVVSSGQSREHLLANQKLATRGGADHHWRPTNLGLLLFSERPDRHLGEVWIDAAVYDHEAPDGDTVDARRFHGPLPEQAEAVLSWLDRSPFLTTISHKSGAGRHDRPAYSRWALQEAVVNAIVHRDYQLRSSQIRVYVFPSRLEVWSPGGLHNTLTPEDLYAGCQPIRRNQLLAGFLREYESPLTGARYMETRGEGFLNLVRESERLSGRRPELRVQGEAVHLRIFAAHAPGQR